MLAASVVALISGCATQENICEDITMASEQVQQCQSLQKKITQAKGRPILRTELERRYEQDCINIRYYRDDKQQAICGNKQQLKEADKVIQKEQN